MILSLLYFFPNSFTEYLLGANKVNNQTPLVPTSR